MWMTSRMSGRGTVEGPRNIGRAITPLGIGVAVSLLGDNTLYTVLPNPPIAAQAGVTLSMVGVLLGVNRLVRVFTNPAAGMLYDRNRRRPLMISALILGALSTVVFALGRGFPLLFLGRLMWGAAWSGIWIGGNTIALDIAQDHDRGAVSGRFQMWFFIGVSGAALLGGVFTDVLGFRKGLGVSAALTACAALMWALSLPETRPGDLHLDRLRESRGATPFPWRHAALVSLPVLVMRFAFAGVMASTTILWLSRFVGQEANLGWLVIPLASLTGGFVAVRTLLSVVGAPLAGWISDSVGHRWTVMSGAFVLGALGIWLMAGSIFPLALFGAVLASMAAGAIQALAPALAGDRIAGEHRSRGMAMMFTLGDIGSALGPPLALGLLRWTSLSVVYRATALTMAASAGYALTLWQVERRQIANDGD
jgi:MFS family permease